MKLIIAEKPSVAQSIAKVLNVTERKDGYLQGGEYIVSWCVGHLVGFADAAAYDEKYAKWRYEDLPILPEPWQLAVNEGRGKQFKVVGDLMHDKRVTSLVCATDAGREGELIFRFVYDMAGCDKPFERLWISSMEDAAIKEGFANLRPGTDYENLYASALCRAKADWIVGINATRLFSTLYGATLNVGRVQSPTLAMLVERAAQIGGFQKEKYYHARIASGGVEAASEKLKDRAAAEQMQAACQNGHALVASVQQEQKTVNPPKLYDLTSLQREANRLYGYTAQQTLDYAQSLYEKKLITYPRTDSQYLTADMEETAAAIAALLIQKLPFMDGFSYSPALGRVINDGKVSDHHAIIPTMELSRVDVASLPEPERAVVFLIGARLLCATAEPHTFEAVTAVLECAGHSFTAKGKTVTASGWKEVERLFRASVKARSKGKAQKDDEDEGEQDKALPPLQEGQQLDGVQASVTEHTTTPPKPYTEDTLLSAMETAGNGDAPLPEDAEKKGLGTPATRASVIEKLVSSGVAERKGKQLLPTEKGTTLIAVLPDVVKSAKLTAEWESALTQIAKGSLTAKDFMDGIVFLTNELVVTHNRAEDDKKALFAKPKGEVIGTCPRCGADVVEGKSNFHCSDRACKFVMWKDDRFFTNKKKTLTKKMAAELLKHGKVAVKGLYSEKKGSTYDATVLLADTGDKYVNFRLDFGDKVN